MPEPTTGLLVDWIPRLYKALATIQAIRREELQYIRNVFGDPELLAKHYIELPQSWCHPPRLTEQLPQDSPPGLRLRRWPRTPGCSSTRSTKRRVPLYLSQLGGETLSHRFWARCPTRPSGRPSTPDACGPTPPDTGRGGR